MGVWGLAPVENIGFFFLQSFDTNSGISEVRKVLREITCLLKLIVCFYFLGRQTGGVRPMLMGTKLVARRGTCLPNISQEDKDKATIITF